MHFTNLDLLLLLSTTLQCATGVFCRSYGDGAKIDVTKLTTNAARMQAGFPPLKPRSLNIPSRIQVGGKINILFYNSSYSHFVLFKNEPEIHGHQWYLRMRQPIL